MNRATETRSSCHRNCTVVSVREVNKCLYRRRMCSNAGHVITRECFAGCGSGGESVYLRDLGNGTCQGLFERFSPPKYHLFDCGIPTILFGGGICQYFIGDLYLSIENAAGLPAATYIPPQFQTWLTNVGLGEVILVGTCICTSYGTAPHDIICRVREYPHVNMQVQLRHF
jgi:hypothetical protein